MTLSSVGSACPGGGVRGQRVGVRQAVLSATITAPGPSSVEENPVEGPVQLREDRVSVAHHRIADELR